MLCQLMGPGSRSAAFVSKASLIYTSPEPSKPFAWHLRGQRATRCLPVGKPSRLALWRLQRKEARRDSVITYSCKKATTCEMTSGFFMARWWPSPEVSRRQEFCQLRTMRRAFLKGTIRSLRS
jgi:hypothetical protein